MHLPSCFKGPIFGELRRYWSQNTPENFQKLLSKFIQRLLDRGHTLQTLVPIMSQAAMAIDQNGQHHTAIKRMTPTHLTFTGAITRQNTMLGHPPNLQ